MEQVSDMELFEGKQLAPPPAVKKLVLGVRAPVSLKGSHGLEKPGFQSAQTGIFREVGASTQEPPQPIEIDDVTILGLALSHFRLTSIADDRFDLRLNFAEPLPEAEAFEFLQQLADAWSLTFAPTQRDGWHGNLYVHISWSGVEAIETHGPMIVGSLGLQARRTVWVDKAFLETLHWSPLVDVFVEGMKAAQPKSKFLFWFVILEELERRDEFAELFTPVFNNEDKAAVHKALAGKNQALNRLKSLLNNPAVTTESRAEKLCRILHHIGIEELSTISEDVMSVDLALCADLIKQRNQVAHKGSKISEFSLYMVLFPLSQRALTYMLSR